MLYINRCNSRAFWVKQCFIIAVIVGLIGCGETTPTKEAPAVKLVPQESLDSLGEAQALKYQKALGLLRQEKYEDAEKHFVELRKKYPGLLELQLNLGVAYYHQQRYDQAAQAAAQAVAINATSAIAQNLSGLIAIKQGAFRDAESFFLAALNIDAKYAYANYNLALLYDVYLHNIPSAVAYYQRYMADNKNDETTAAWIEHLKASVH